jgi:hypothetical protein
MRHSSRIAQCQPFGFSLNGYVIFIRSTRGQLFIFFGVKRKVHLNKKAYPMRLACKTIVRPASKEVVVGLGDKAERKGVPLSQRPGPLSNSLTQYTKRFSKMNTSTRDFHSRKHRRIISGLGVSLCLRMLELAKSRLDQSCQHHGRRVVALLQGEAKVICCSVRPSL